MINSLIAISRRKHHRGRASLTTSVRDADGTLYTILNDVRDADGTIYGVDDKVRDADGTLYIIFV